VTFARALICVLAIGAGLLLAVPSALRAVSQVHTLVVPTVSPPVTRVTRPDSTPANPDDRRLPVALAYRNPSHVAPTPSATTRGDHRSSIRLFRLVGLEIAAGIALIWLVAVGLTLRRLHRRRIRTYELYELHLSTHDQAKAQDLQDMVESIANLVRAWPADRLRDGQPYVALELICDVIEGADEREMEWSLNVRCEPSVAVALDGAISAAYPDVRLGRIHGEQPLRRAGQLREPAYLMRFRKERSFVYSLIAGGELQASSPIEQIARAQIAQGAPSLVRFQLTPPPSCFEELARRVYRHHERGLVRHERWGLRAGGLTSTFNRAEMRAAERTHNRSLFWLETVVAADSRAVGRAIAAAVQSRRGENRLHRRWMILRHRLYRRRFPSALGPLVPSWRCLVSAAEVAHLLELPSARMKGVPVRRVPLPRIPAPPEVARGSRGRRVCAATSEPQPSSVSRAPGGDGNVGAPGVS
jgi:hypothetical protein